MRWAAVERQMLAGTRAPVRRPLSRNRPQPPSVDHQPPSVATHRLLIRVPTYQSSAELQSLFSREGARRLLSVTLSAALQVHALGVLLLELLTGHVDPRRRGYGQRVRGPCDLDPRAGAWPPNIAGALLQLAFDCTDEQVPLWYAARGLVVLRGDCIPPLVEASWADPSPEPPGHVASEGVCRGVWAERARRAVALRAGDSSRRRRRVSLGPDPRGPHRTPIRTGGGRPGFQTRAPPPPRALPN